MICITLKSRYEIRHYLLAVSQKRRCHAARDNRCPSLGGCQCQPWDRTTQPVQKMHYVACRGITRSKNFGCVVIFVIFFGKCIWPKLIRATRSVCCICRFLYSLPELSAPLTVPVGGGIAQFSTAHCRMLTLGTTPAGTFLPEHIDRTVCSFYLCKCLFACRNRSNRKYLQRCTSLTPFAWANKPKSYCKQINSMNETNGTFYLYNSCKWLGPNCQSFMSHMRNVFRFFR